MRPAYLTAGIAGLLLFLLAYLPAPLLHHWLRDDWGPQTQAFGVSGNLWRGKAVVVSIGGIALHDVRWRWRPHALLLGRISHRVTALSSGGQMEAIVASSMIGSTLRLYDLKGTLPIEQVGRSMQLPVMPFSGRIQLALEMLKLRNGRLWNAEGAVDFDQVQFNFTSPAVVLGNYRAEIGTDKDLIHLALTSQGGQLEAEGTANVTREGQYSLDMRLRPRATAPAAVASLMQSLGQPAADGWYSLRQNGAY